MPSWACLERGLIIYLGSMALPIWHIQIAMVPHTSDPQQWCLSLCLSNEWISEKKNFLTLSLNLETALTFCSTDRFSKISHAPTHMPKNALLSLVSNIPALEITRMPIDAVWPKGHCHNRHKLQLQARGRASHRRGGAEEATAEELVPSMSSFEVDVVEPNSIY